MNELNFFKSSYSEPQQACVETAMTPDVTHIRDSKDVAASPILRVAPSAWSALIAGVKQDTI